MANIRLRKGVVVERVDKDFLVLQGNSSMVYRASGDVAILLQHLMAGEIVTAANMQATEDLIAKGICEEVKIRPGLSRRSVLALSGTGLGAGILSLSLPAAAASSSLVCRTFTSAEDFYLRLFFPESSNPQVEVEFADLAPSDGNFWLVAHEVERVIGQQYGSRTGPQVVFNIQFQLISSSFRPTRNEVDEDFFEAPALEPDKDYDWVLYSDEGLNCVVAERLFDYFD